jgi:hypothetical protein
MRSISYKEKFRGVIIYLHCTDGKESFMDSLWINIVLEFPDHNPFPKLCLVGHFPKHFFPLVGISVKEEGCC